MKEQPAGGHVFNMDGAGADGNATPRFAAYGATKRSLQQVGPFGQSCRACWCAMCSDRKVVASSRQTSHVAPQSLNDGTAGP
jgi:hypothetical protein